MATTKEHIEKINAMFTSGNMENFMDYLAEDATWDFYSSAKGHKSYQSKAEINDMGSEGEHDHMDFTFTNVVIEGPVASVEGYSNVTKADGAKAKANFCDIYHFRDDKIVKVTSYVIEHGG